MFIVIATVNKTLCIPGLQADMEELRGLWGLEVIHIFCLLTVKETEFLSSQCLDSFLYSPDPL